MSPRRGPGWVPKLTHRKSDGRGRVRIPGRGDVYLGAAGDWPAARKHPPAAIVRAYRALVAEWMARQQAGTDEAVGAASAGTLTVAQLVVAYRRHVRRAYTKRGKPTSLLKTVNAFCRPLLELFADRLAGSLGPAESRAVRDALLRTGTRSLRTVTKDGSHFRAMFAWAAEEGLVPEAVALVIRGTRWFRPGREGTRQRRQPPPEADVLATLEHLPDGPAAMVRLQMLTGMRPEEVCWMRLGDVDTLDPDGLWVYTARDDANKLAHRGVPKVVFLGPQARQVLRPFLERASVLGPDGWLFPLTRTQANSEGHYTPDRYGRVVRQACEAAGVTPWSPGRLRHYRGTRTRARYGKDGAQAELGHLRSETTESYTFTALEELARRIARETG